MKKTSWTVGSMAATALIAGGLFSAACSSSSGGGGGGGSGSSSGGGSGSGSSSGGATSNGACWGEDGLFCYQWTNLDASGLMGFCGQADSGVGCGSDTCGVMSACPTAAVAGTCTITEGSGSYAVIAYGNCARAKQMCQGGGSSNKFTGGC